MQNILTRIQKPFKNETHHHENNVEDSKQSLQFQLHEHWNIGYTQEDNTSYRFHKKVLKKGLKKVPELEKVKKLKRIIFKKITKKALKKVMN